MKRLKTIRLVGWRSISDQTLEFGPITVLVGANGAGKSNVISFLKMLNDAFANFPRLGVYVGTHGKAAGLLHFGPKKTPTLECDMIFETPNGESGYSARWGFGAGDQLVFLDEKISFHRPTFPAPQTESLGTGHSETKLIAESEKGNETARILLGFIRGCRVFHFHDTSDTAAVRRPCDMSQNKFLMPDAGNLPAMLFLYKQRYPREYQRIRAAARQMIPGFADFVLEPDELDKKQIELRWVGEKSDYEFAAHQLSDGSIRLISLATLLLQPVEKLPLLIALDEPELGLHPAALSLLAEMVHKASQSCQVLLATQSALLLDQFDPESIVVVDNTDNVTSFRRLSDETAVEGWLKEFTISELWERNFIGGGPS